MSWLLPSVIATFLGTFILAFIYLYLYSQNKSRYLCVWTISWFIYSMRFIFMILMVLGGKTAFLTIGNQTLAVVSGFLLLWGTYIFIDRKIPKIWLIFTSCDIVWIIISVLSDFSFFLTSFPTFTFLGIVDILIGIIFLRSSAIEGLPKYLVGWTFILWGIHKVDYPFLQPVLWFAPWGYLLAATLELVVAIGILLVYFQKMRTESIKNEGKYRTLVENLPQNIFLKDINSVYLSCNDNFAAAVNINKRHIAGKTDYDFFPNELAERYRADDKRILESGITEEIEEPYSLSGKQLWVHMVKTPVKNDVGNTTGILGIFWDITERKQSEEDLKLFRSLIDQSNEAIFIIDPATGSILDFNPTVCNSLGYNSEELHNMKVTDFEVSLPDSFSWEKHVNDVRSMGPLIMEGVHRRKNGSTLPVEINVKYLTIEENDYMVALVRDITERKKLESQLMHAQKMESVGTLAGGIAHDFNNIITAIMGFSSILSRRLQKDDPLKIYVVNIQTAAENAANLTRNLLTFSRKQTIKPVLLELNDLINKLEKFLLRVIGEDILFKTVLADMHLNVKVDFGQIEQVLMNLVTNARDSMPKGGELTISTESVRIGNDFVTSHGYGEPGPYALISISDTGSGMNEITKENIFEPFFTTKDVNKGTGLGLAMVYGIIKQHNGYINVESMPGAGTTFRIYLPINGKEIPVHEEKAVNEAATAGGRETILIAEDDSMIRNLLSSIFTEYGYRVISAEDGDDAVNKFLENREIIQFLILDAIMPKKYGSDVFNEIKKIAPDIKAIFLSGYTKETINEKDTIEKGIRLVHKPIKPEELLRIVREELDKKI